MTDAALDLSHSSSSGRRGAEPPLVAHRPLDVRCESTSSCEEDASPVKKHQPDASLVNAASGHAPFPLLVDLPGNSSARSTTSDTENSGMSNETTPQTDSESTMGKRPFKVYPQFDSGLSSVYSQMAVAANTGGMNPMAGLGGAGMAPVGLMNPFAAAAMGSPLQFGLMDNSLAITSSIGQFLAHKRRRVESSLNRRSPGRKPNGSASGVEINGVGSAIRDTNEQEQNALALEGEPASTESDQPEASGGTLAESTSSNAKKVKSVATGGDSSSSSGGEIKDASYWERRRKNNEAAKRSRDSRRAKEEEIAIRAAYLEQENLKLRAQVAVLKHETQKLHYLLYQQRA